MLAKGIEASVLLSAAAVAFPPMGHSRSKLQQRCRPGKGKPYNSKTTQRATRTNRNDLLCSRQPWTPFQCSLSHNSLSATANVWHWLISLVRCGVARVLLPLSSPDSDPRWFDADGKEVGCSYSCTVISRLVCRCSRMDLDLSGFNTKQEEGRLCRVCDVS
jgi:hypothetical protein